MLLVISVLLRILAVGHVLMLLRLILRLIWLMLRIFFVNLLFFLRMILILVLMMLRLCLDISLNIFRLLENRFLGLSSSWRYVMLIVLNCSVIQVIRSLLGLIQILFLMMNKFINLVVRDAPLECPFQIKSKCEPTIAAAVVAGVASLIGGLLSVGSQSDANSSNFNIAKLNAESQRQTNQSNAEIARQTNLANLGMLREQNAFNLDMWNKQNEYNSPSHVVQMLKQAGLNPALMYGNTAPASSIGSADAKPAEKSYNVAPQLDYQQNPINYNQMFDSVGSAINAYYQNQLISSEASRSKSQTVGSDIENDKNKRAMQDELQLLRNQAKGSGYQAEQAKRMLDFYNLSFKTRLNMVYGDAQLQQKNLRMLEKQIAGIDLDNQLKEIEALYRPKFNDKQLQQFDAVLSQVYAQIGLIQANTFLTNEQARHEIVKKIGSIIDNGLKGIDHDIKKATKDNIIQASFNALDMQNVDRSWKRANEFLGVPGKVLGIANLFK